MENKQSSNSSMCQKIRTAVAACPAFRAIFGNPNSNPPPASQTKLGFPQHPKGYSTEGAGTGIIPIEYDYSTTPKSPSIKVPPLDAQNGKNFDHEFTKYVERNKQKIRGGTNAGGGGQSKAATDDGNGAKKKDSHKDHIADFLDRAKKKITATSNVGKANSLKRG